LAVLTFNSRFTSSEVVAIKLENTEPTYFLQKAQLIGVSSYFSAALEGTFKESIERVLKLPGCEKDAFELLLYWLCHRELPDLVDYTFDGNSPDSEEEVSEEEPERTRAAQVQVALVRLWCFADAILTPQLQNVAMKSLLNCFEQARVTVEGLRTTFSLTSYDSLLRKAMLDEFTADYAYEKIFRNNSKNYTAEEKDSCARISGFMSELASRLMSCGVKDHQPAYRQEHSIYMVPCE
jgi:hypothetical protein